MPRTQPPRHQHGFTLLELSFVLAGILILMAITAGVWASMRASSENYGASSQLSELSGAVQSLYPLHDYTGLTVTSLIASGVLPKNLLSEDGTTIRNDWGGIVQVSGIGLSGAPGAIDGYSIRLYAVPRDACNRLIAAHASAFARVAVGATTPSTIVKSDLGSPKVTYNRAAVATACDRPTSAIAFMNG